MQDPEQRRLEGFPQATTRRRILTTLLASAVLPATTSATPKPSSVNTCDDVRRPCPSGHLCEKAKCVAAHHNSTWGSVGHGDGQFVHPHDVEVDAQGHVYVTEFGGTRVQRFSADGSFQLSWGHTGDEDGQFADARGIAAAPDGTIYVVDGGNFRVQRFQPNGEFVGKWGTEGDERGQFQNPMGITVDSAGTIYVAQGNLPVDTIQIFSPTGAWTDFLGTGGQGLRPPGWLRDIATRDSTMLYSSDSSQRQIFVTTLFENGASTNGRPVRTGRKHRVTFHAFGVAVSPDGTVFFADTYNHRVLRFSADLRTPISQLGSPGSAPGKFRYPAGVAVSLNGTLYVADYGNNRIQSFTPGPL